MAKASSALDRIKALDTERSAILDEAKEEALAKANTAIAELNELGFSYQLMNGTKPASKAKVAERKSPQGPCNICEFTTDPAHDGRRHRAQGENKQPFSKSELVELGLTRID